MEKSSVWALGPSEAGFELGPVAPWPRDQGSVLTSPVQQHQRAPGPHGCKDVDSAGVGWRTRAGLWSQLPSEGMEPQLPESRAVLSTPPRVCPAPGSCGHCPPHMTLIRGLVHQDRGSPPVIHPLMLVLPSGLSASRVVWFPQAVHVEASVPPLALPFPSAPPSCLDLVHILQHIRLAALSRSVCGASSWMWSPGQRTEPPELGQPPQTLPSCRGAGAP